MKLKQTRLTNTAPPMKINNHHKLRSPTPQAPEQKPKAQNLIRDPIFKPNFNNNKTKNISSKINFWEQKGSDNLGNKTTKNDTHTDSDKTNLRGIKPKPKIKRESKFNTKESYTLMDFGVIRKQDQMIRQGPSQEELEGSETRKATVEIKVLKR